MKIIAFNGSPRLDGNTAILLNHVLEPLKAKGMTRVLVTMALAVGCVWVAGCVPNQQPVTPRPTTPASAPGEEGLTEGGITFNSTLGLKVWVCDGKAGTLTVSHTPADQPLTIPKCLWWAVEPLPGVSVADMVAEAHHRTIPDLLLKNATDGDLAQVSEWPQLQGLFLAETRITDAGLVYLRKMKTLRTLDVSWTGITDAGLLSLKDMSSLQTLDLMGTEVTDVGLAHIVMLHGLRTLDLYGTYITDAGLVRIKELKGLQSLNLGGTKITDAGLQHLRELKGLKELILYETTISDAGFAHLKEITTLRTLNLQTANVTDAGLEDLRKALPNTRIIGPFRQTGSRHTPRRKTTTEDSRPLEMFLDGLSRMLTETQPEEQP